MTYFDDLIGEASAYLPLKIGYVLITQATLTIGEMRAPEVVNWSFSTYSAWRLSHAAHVVMSCEWQSDLLESRLLGRSIVSIEHQGVGRVPDAAFVLDDAVRLEIFSTHVLDPWTFRLPNDATITGEIW